MLITRTRNIPFLLLTACFCSLSAATAWSQEIEPEAPVEETTPMPVAPAPVTPQPPTVIYVVPAPVPAVAVEQDPRRLLRRMPRTLRPIEGQDPPENYVVAEKKKKGLIISGAAVFGGFYMFCLVIGESNNNFQMMIPVAGPMISGFSNAAEDDRSADEKYALRLVGTLGTAAQLTGVALFTAGMLSKKKVWLRHDLAGVSFQIAPTMVGYRDPGLGISGTF